jgi:hypothetical protein
MSDDFPAAHSMDTIWFAVDCKGRVGVFWSAEEGHVPDRADIAPKSESFDFLLELWRLRRGSTPEDEEEFRDHDDQDQAEQLGVIYYSYGDEFDPIGTYWRMVTPENPLHIDQLPPNLRERVKSFSFSTLDFTETRVIQPLEHYDCSFWDDEDRVAYVASDDKTVRPLPFRPGREKGFWAFVEEFRKANPEQAAQFLFEGPEEKPAEKKRRKKGKSDE